MGFMKKLIIVVIVLVGAVYLWGRSLPREHTASSTITITARPDTVFGLIRNVGGSANWWIDVKSVRPLAGKPRESWEQDMGAMGKVQIEVVSAAPPTRMVTRILNDEQQDWGGTWTYDVTHTAAGTEVTITEEGWVAPFFRVFAKLMGPHRTMDSYLTSVAANFGEVTSARHRR
jgi:uncharacterized protein YndB with AHSA1/START domain